MNIYLISVIVILTIINVQCSKLLPTARKQQILLDESNDSDNTILNTNNNNNIKQKSTEWVKITQSPEKQVNVNIGSYLELECEAIGSPSPQIQWLKDNIPIPTISNINNDLDQYINNNIININNLNSNGLARIKSRLVLQNALPIHSGVITCYAQSGGLTQVNKFVQTNLYVNGKPKHGSSSVSTQGGQQTQDLDNSKQIRIVLFNTFIMETIGSNIIMPCKIINNDGASATEIYWFDNNEQLITSSTNEHHSRIKVLENGDLSINNLRWSDMGSYVCVARNTFTEDSISTFVYPMLNDN